ncbi:MAG: M28 family peptidase [Bacteroidia bacterium]|nr:M28 family peptidase [Bacteroidia bacterium]
MLKAFLAILFLPAFMWSQYDSVAARYAQFIDRKDLKKHLQIFAGDKFEGRESGKKGQKKAAKYLASEFKKNGALPPGDTSYFQVYEINTRDKDTTQKTIIKLKSENVIAFIEGTDLKNEFIVISAHYDHLGKKLKVVYNGADDDGSGSVTLLELAQAFAEAKRNGHGPRRSIVFIGFSGEEKGLLGSKYYVKHPVYPLAKTVCNLNIDMIGRVDKKHVADSNYVYVIGSDKISTQVHNTNEESNYIYTRLTLDYTFNDIEDKNRFYYRSDHYNFARNGVPVIFYFNGVHEDYHRESDEEHKIIYPLLEKRARLVFFTAWMIANDPAPILRNKSSK